MHATIGHVTKVNVSSRVVVSRKAKKKQHARMSFGLHDHYSELSNWIVVGMNAKCAMAVLFSNE